MICTAWIKINIGFLALYVYYLGLFSGVPMCSEEYSKVTSNFGLFFSWLEMVWCIVLQSAMDGVAVAFMTSISFMLVGG